MTSPTIDFIPGKQYLSQGAGVATCREIDYASCNRLVACFAYPDNKIGWIDRCGRSITEKYTITCPYAIGEWHPWAGGECPVPEGTRVKIRCKNGHEEESLARMFSWTERKHGFTITAFMIRPPAEPGPVQPDHIREVANMVGAEPEAGTGAVSDMDGPDSYEGFIYESSAPQTSPAYWQTDEFRANAAVAAMQGQLSNAGLCQAKPADIVLSSFFYADALIAQLEKTRK